MIALKQLMPALLVLMMNTLPGAGTEVAPPGLCRIQVVDRENGWPVPLVELRTVNQQRYVTDNAGVIAFDAPDLMGWLTWFDVIGHGYEVGKDGFGMRGVRVTPEAGKTLKVEVTRTNIARRIGRLTGAGLYAESQRLGEMQDWQEQGIVGCDSVQNAVHNGRMFWAWGDTAIPGYPLGVFDMSSATTPVQPLERFEPPLKLRFDYFRDDKGAVRGVARMPGSGPTWVSGYTALPDKTGKIRLVGSYVKIKPPMDAYESGLCVWHEETNSFVQHKVLWKQDAAQPKQPPMPSGHPALWKDEQGREWIYFGDPLPVLRCPATFEAWEDPTQWEKLPRQESLKGTGGQGKVVPHSGSIAWSGYRKRWVSVFMESFGKPSVFGELWYAEADHPTGPWGPAVKVITHQNYTFYNPRLHPEFTPEGSPILIFEGTYTMQFADHAHATPRYDYNQILYRLDLDDPKLSEAKVATKSQ